MIAPDEAEKHRLARLDSPARVTWLREKVRGYVTDLAARAYFRLPTVCCDHDIDDPKHEAFDCCLRLAESHDLTDAECAAAFKAEWTAAMNIAVQVGEKLKIAGLSHVKITGTGKGVEEALQTVSSKFPAGWPHLTPDDLSAIAAGFQRPTKTRRVT